MDLVSGQTENVTWCSSGTSPMPILKATFRSAPIMRLMSGTRCQNFIATEGFTVARVSAARGPVIVFPVGLKGF